MSQADLSNSKIKESKLSLLQKSELILTGLVALVVVVLILIP